MKTNIITKLSIGLLAAIITLGAPIATVHADERANREAADRARAADLNARIQAHNAQVAAAANAARAAEANARAQQLAAERARQANSTRRK